MVQITLFRLMAEKQKEDSRVLSFARLGKESGIDKRRISAMATGKASRVYLEEINKLCTYFGCEPGDLFVRTSGGE